MLRVCIAGATGWAGRPIAEAVLAAEDLELVSAVARLVRDLDTLLLSTTSSTG
jgi:4-hydroxy-tetrahydrodipicolinate reductase